ncbi:MAG: J domain-containing protein [Treponema sp.]|nr:J domain-containing protein [Treponema sp.]
MGIFDRLGKVINSYLNDFGEQTSQSFRSGSRSSSNDPDLDAAYDELNDFLNQKETQSKSKSDNRYWQEPPRSDPKDKSIPPEELRADFECLGVPFGADKETCKAAYKNLLKIHHPDRHAGHEGNIKKATAKSAIINAAWDRIEKWRNE